MTTKKKRRGLTGRFAAMRRTGVTGAGIRVGHLDSGLSASHPELRGRIAAYCHFDRFGKANPHAAPTDALGHGTHTAGIVARIAPGASLASAVVVESGYVVLRILRGLDWLLDQGIRVALLPIGLREQSPVFWHLIAAMRARGILPIAAVGNGGAGRAYSPGWYPHVLSVGAHGPDQRIARLSGSLNVGTQCHKPDVVALGVDLVAADPAGGVAAQSGTSMAAAVVAAVAAQLFEAVPGTTPEAIESALFETARPPSEDQSHRVRRGRVDPLAALEFLRAHGDRPRPPSIADLPTAPSYTDSRLIRQLQYGDEGEHVPLIVVGGSQPVSEAILRVTRAVGERPRQRLDIPRGNAAFVLATRRCARQLVSDPGIVVATPPDADVFA